MATTELHTLDKSTLTLLYVAHNVRPTEIAKIFGCEARKVTHLLGSFGIPMLARQGVRSSANFILSPSAPDTASNDIIKRYYSEGKSDYAIAKLCGASEDLVRGRRLAMGLNLEDRPGWEGKKLAILRTKSDEELAADLASLSDEAMLRKYGTPRGTWEPYLVSRGVFASSAPLEVSRYEKGQKGLTAPQAMDAVSRLVRLSSRGTALSRDQWKGYPVQDTIYPSYAIEHYFGGWLSFVRAAKLAPLRGTTTSRDNVRDYLDACHEASKVLSPPEYAELRGGSGDGKQGDKYAQRLQRLFGEASGRNRHLRQQLFAACLNQEEASLFLDKYFPE